MTNAPTNVTEARTALRLAPGVVISIYRVHVPTRLYATTYRVLYVPAASPEKAYRMVGKTHGWHGIRVWDAAGVRHY